MNSSETGIVEPRPVDAQVTSEQVALGGRRSIPLGHLLFDSREANFIAVIDKRSDNIVWRLGPDSAEPKIRADADTLCYALSREDWLERAAPI